jgi:hypothetical protein
MQISNRRSLKIFLRNNDFWYRNTFEISRVCQGRRLWMVFQGVNWKAAVYLNGTKLGEIAGAFIRTRFDITKVAVRGGPNCLAVLGGSVDNIATVESSGSIAPLFLPALAGIGCQRLGAATSASGTMSSLRPAGMCVIGSLGEYETIFFR